ncbi:hypothetical protein NE664_04570 [Anaerotignum faecicola]|nr:hypothetical protein [Anaerotignum faecicola]
MENILTGINRNEVLKYLGYKGGGVDPETENAVKEAGKMIIENVVPRFIYSVFDIGSDGVSLEGTLFKPLGNDIKNMLEGCEKCVLMAATLGAGFEAMLRRAQVTDMAKAVILDSCASSAIENVCDNIQEIIRKKFEEEGLYITDRFSPGYGDMPLSQQRDFINVLDAQRKIGLSVTGGGMLVPTKSVTALIGVSKTPKEMRKRGCEYCSNFDNCQYRKEGTICG